MTDGTIAGYGPDSPASGGQIVSALGLAEDLFFGGPAKMALDASTLDKTNRTLSGRQWDDAFGGTPGTPVPTRNPIANNTNSRGDNDTRLMDRASAAARSELDGVGSSSATGDVTTGGDDGGAEFSSVKLADRRRPYDGASAVDLLRGLL